MSRPLGSRIVGVLLCLLATGCSLEASRSAADPSKRWVLVSNLRYSGQGNEPEYVWVEEDKVPTTLTTVFFGKKALVAPSHVVPRYAPPPGNGTISPLQGAPYASQMPQPALAPVAPKDRPPAVAGSAIAPGGRAATTPALGLTPRGYIVYVDATRVVIDMSAQHGLKAGDIVKVTREKIPLVHPLTGAYLGELDEEIATAQIVELREKFAIAEIKDLAPGAQIRVKDRVVPRP